MKVSILYENNLIHTKLSHSTRVRDLLLSLKNSPSFKSLLSPDFHSELLLLDDNLNPASEDDFVNSSDITQEKKFYLIARRKYSPLQKSIPDIEEAITQVTGGKTKLKKKPQGTPTRTHAINDRLELIQQLANSFNQFPTVLPGMQNRANEINRFTEMLRNMVNAEMVDINPQGRRPQHQQAHVEPDENSLRQLQEMGFPEENCRRALILARNNISRATDLLINDELDYLPGENNQADDMIEMFEEDNPEGELDGEGENQN